MVNYTKEVKEILKRSELEAFNEGSSEVNSKHLLISLINVNTIIKNIFIKYNVKIENKINKKTNNHITKTYSNELKKIIENSHIITNDSTEESNIISLALSLLECKTSIGYKILEKKCNVNKLYKEINKLSNNNNESYLTKLGINLNDNIENPSKVIAYNREKEINEILQILNRKTKNNPLLIGEAGVGKTAIAEELARLIKINEIPINMKNKKIIMLNISDIISGTKYRGEFEEKLNNIIHEACNDENIILFIDEIHTIVGAGGAEGAIDAANILKPELARGRLKIIGATTYSEYMETIQKDKALDRRFQKIKINEPTIEETKKILKKVKKEYEEFHNVEINDEIIEILPQLSNKYIKNKYEPDKSIDILDELCSQSKLNNSYKTIKTLTNTKNKLKIEKLKNINNDKYKQAIKLDKEIQNITNKINLIYKNKNKITKENLYNIFKEKTNTEIYELNKENIKTKINKTLIPNKEEIIKKLEKDETIYFKIKDNKHINDLSNILKREIIEVNGTEFNNAISISKFIGTTQGYIGYEDNNTIFDKLYNNPNAILKLTNTEKIHTNIKSIINSIKQNNYLINNKNQKLNLTNLIIIELITEKDKNKIGYINKQSINV